MDEGPKLTVEELIEKLSHMPALALVSTEGCDCCGPAAGVSLDQDGDVLITRSEDE